MIRILVAEDDEIILNLIKINLKKVGYSVSTAGDGVEASKLMDEEQFDLCLFDIMLPKIDGYELLEYAKSMEYPVIFITAMGTTDNKVRGLKAGADDYITKPFSLLVLISKVNACMRRTEKQSGQILISGDLEVHCHTMQVYRNRDAIVLSKKEIQLLICLMEHAGTVLTKEQILERVWDKDGQFVDDNTVTVNISRLKNKLDTNAIENIRGLGYIWTGTVTKK